MQALLLQTLVDGNPSHNDVSIDECKEISTLLSVTTNLQKMKGDKTISFPDLVFHQKHKLSEIHLCIKNCHLILLNKSELRHKI